MILNLSLSTCFAIGFYVITLGDSWKVPSFTSLTSTFKDSNYDASSYIYYKDDSKALSFPAGGYAYYYVSGRYVSITGIGYSNYLSSTYWTNGKTRAVTTSKETINANVAIDRCRGASVICVKDN